MLRASARETSIDRKCRFPLRGTERSHMSMVPPPPTWGRVGVGEARDDCRPPRRGFPHPDLPHAGGGGFNACSSHVCLPCAPSDSSVSRASAAWANAPPARISAATQIASMISAGVAPSRVAALVWPWMQYGHWVTCATATAISCLVLRGSAPSRNTASLNLWKAASASGASAARFSASARLGFGYIESVMARPFHLRSSRSTGTDQPPICASIAARKSARAAAMVQLPARSGSLDRAAARARARGSAGRRTGAWVVLMALSVAMASLAASQAGSDRLGSRAIGWGALGRARNRSSPGEVAVGEVPADEMPDHRVGVVGAPVLVVEVVGVLPHVEREQRDLAVGDRGVGVAGGRDGELAAILHQPSPAAAELAGGGSRERRGKGFITAKIAIDAGGDLSVRVTAAARLQRPPIEGVVPGLRSVVEERAMAVLPGRLLDDQLKRQVRQAHLLRQCSRLVDIGLVMLAVMQLERAARDEGLQGFVGIRKGRQSELHGGLPDCLS